MLRRFFLAVTAVTSLPLADLHHDPHALAGLSKYLPAVGALIGAILCLTALALAAFCHASPLSTAIILTLGWLILSGGIHFDGLMDTADGVFSHASPQRMLEIMHDSRVGNFGVLTGVSALLIKIGGIAALASRDQMFLLCALMLIPVWSRWCETFAIGKFAYLREQGLGKVWHDTTRYPHDVLLAGIFPSLLTGACVYQYGYGAVAVPVLATLACGLLAAFHFKNTLQGHTGDTYGAVVELAEAGALLCAMLFST